VHNGCRQLHFTTTPIPESLIAVATIYFGKTAATNASIKIQSEMKTTIN